MDRRQTILKMLDKSRSGHIGAAFSCLDIISVLYDDILTPDDRFILSKGHGCLALYAVLADHGFFAEEELYKVGEDGALLGGHPDHACTDRENLVRDGCETSQKNVPEAMRAECIYRALEYRGV